MFLITTKLEKVLNNFFGLCATSYFLQEGNQVWLKKSNKLCEYLETVFSNFWKIVFEQSFCHFSILLKDFSANLKSNYIQSLCFYLRSVSGRLARDLEFTAILQTPAVLTVCSLRFISRSGVDDRWDCLRNRLDDVLGKFYPLITEQVLNIHKNWLHFLNQHGQIKPRFEQISFFFKSVFKFCFYYFLCL